MKHQWLDEVARKEILVGKLQNMEWDKPVFESRLFSRDDQSKGTPLAFFALDPDLATV